MYQHMQMREREGYVSTHADEREREGYVSTHAEATRLATRSNP